MNSEEFDKVNSSLTSLWCLLNVLCYNVSKFENTNELVTQIDNAKFHIEEAIEILNEMRK